MFEGGGLEALAGGQDAHSTREHITAATPPSSEVGPPGREVGPCSCEVCLSPKLLPSPNSLTHCEFSIPDFEKSFSALKRQNLSAAAYRRIHQSGFWEPDALYSRIVRRKLWKIVSDTALGRGWIRRQSRRLESAYVRRLAALPPPSAEVSSPVRRPVPRRMLFIGDCMWEPAELIPELRKIAPCEVFDVHPSLNEPTELPPAARVVRAVEAFQEAASDFDLIVLYLRPELLSDELFDLVRQRWGCPLFGMNLDDRVQFFPYSVYRARSDDYSQWAPRFDLNLTSCRPALEWYRAAGVAVAYLPMGFHPRAETPAETASKRWGLTFVGSWKPERADLLERLRRGGVNPTLFGGGWEDSQWADDPHAIYRGSQLNLGIGLSTATGGISSLKARDLECPGAGGCYLTTYQWELAELYEIGSEILCYRNAEELLEMSRWYLARPDLCAQIALAGQRRALAEHTWERRFRSLFAEEA